VKKQEFIALVVDSAVGNFHDTFGPGPDYPNMTDEEYHDNATCAASQASDQVRTYARDLGYSGRLTNHEQLISEAVMLWLTGRKK